MGSCHEEMPSRHRTLPLQLLEGSGGNREGACVRARAIIMQAQHSRRTRRHNDTLTYTYRQRACVRCLYSARAADDLSRLMQKLNLKKKKKVEVSHAEDRGAMLEDDTQK